MTATDTLATSAATATGSDRLPGFWRAAATRSTVELRGFFRNWQSLIFTLLLPVLLLLVLGSIFSGEVAGTGVDFRQVFVAGIVAVGVMSTAFSGLAINLAIERDSGLVQRLAATPMHRSGYFAGKVAQVAVTTAAETALLLLVGSLAFGLRMPATALDWLTLGWVLTLGTVTCALLAMAYSSLIPNGRSAAAMVTPPFLALQFISGVFFPFHQLPAWMQTVASFFPLKWIAQGLRSVFLPDAYARVEPAGSFELGRVALVLGLWCVAGLVLSLATFRWRDTSRRR